MRSEDRYFESIGRRKTARARVRLYPSSSSALIEINSKKLDIYFPTEALREIAMRTFVAGAKFRVSARLSGGGIHSQAEALAHGLARAFCLALPESKIALKKSGALSRDSRSKERRKFGLKKARKSPQWSKR